MRNLSRQISPIIVAIAMSLAFAEFPVAAQADQDNSRKLPPIPRPSLHSAKPMAIAFSSVPTACRKEVQRQLSSYGFYHGPIDGNWNEAVASGLVQWVGGLKTLAYGWPSVAGSKGILWSIGASEMSCPMPPYDS